MKPLGIACSFCSRDKAAVKKLIAGPEVYVCDQCVVRARLLSDAAP